MRAIVLALVLALVLVSACTIPDKHALGSDAQLVQDARLIDGAGQQLDAPSGAPYACLGQPLPTTAPQTFTISGQTTSLDASGNQALAGVTLSGYVTGQATPIVTLTSDASGNYSVAVPSGGLPIDGHIVANASMYLTANVYPSRPFDSDMVLPVPMITANTLSLAAQFSGVALVSSTAQVVVFVVDCNNTPIADATVEVTTPQGPTGTVRYFSAGVPNQNATATDSSGTALVFNTAGGSLTIHATVPTPVGVLRAHTFVAPNDSSQWTEVTIQP